MPYTITKQLKCIIKLVNTSIKINTDKTVKLVLIHNMQDKLTDLSLIIEKQLIRLNKLEADIQSNQKEGKS